MNQTPTTPPPQVPPVKPPETPRKRRLPKEQRNGSEPKTPVSSRPGGLFNASVKRRLIFSEDDQKMESSKKGKTQSGSHPQDATSICATHSHSAGGLPCDPNMQNIVKQELAPQPPDILPSPLKEPPN